MAAGVAAAAFAGASARETRHTEATRRLLPYLWIGIGSSIGGLGRFSAGALAAAWLGPGFPWGTVFVNVVGSFVIGLFATLTGPDGRLLVGSTARQTVMVGLCGGFTTFSSFSLDTLELLRHARPDAALANISLSLVLCLVSVWLGHAAAETLNR